MSVYLKSIRTSKYTLFEIKILRNSDFASCTKFSVSKIARYTVEHLQTGVQLCIKDLTLLCKRTGTCIVCIQTTGNLLN